MQINWWILLERFISINTNYLIFLIGLLLILLIVLCYNLLSIKYERERYENYKKKYQKEFYIESNRIAMSERETVAKNFHDDVSMPLNLIRMNLNKLSRNNCDKAFSEKLILDSLILLDQSIEHIRCVAKEVCPPTLMKLGYVGGVSELCKQINCSKSLGVNLVIKANEIRLPHSIELEAYRITKEILNNIIKHSYSPEINISIHSDEKGVSTVISHSGFGLDSKTADELSETDKGVGIKSIQCRAGIIGASVQYNKVAWNQYQTKINIPNYATVN